MTITFGPLAHDGEMKILTGAESNERKGDIGEKIQSAAIRQPHATQLTSSLCNVSTIFAFRREM